MVLALNIYDVAKEAGVSIATVSRVLNGKPNISDETRQKVQAVLERYNYVPSGIARGLVTQSMRTVGIILRDIRNAHHACTAFEVEQTLTRSGYQSILCNVGTSSRRIEYYFRMLAENKVDGLILVGSILLSETIEKAIGRYLPGRPVVITNGHLSLDQVYSVICDDLYGVELAISHLWDRGHRGIAHIKAEDAPSARTKLIGYREAMARRQLEVQDGWVVETGYSVEAGHRAALQLMPQILSGRISALLCGEDLLAMGAMMALAEQGLHVPADVAVVGYNHSIYGKLTHPLLTSVDNRLDLQGAVSAKILCDRLEGNDVPTQTTIKPDLFIGETT